MRWEWWVLVIGLTISGVAVLIRGLTESTRTYTIFEGLAGAAECGFYIWLVTRLAS